MTKFTENSRSILTQLWYIEVGPVENVDSLLRGDSRAYSQLVQSRLDPRIALTFLDGQVFRLFFCPLHTQT